MTKQRRHWVKAYSLSYRQIITVVVVVVVVVVLLLSDHYALHEFECIKIMCYKNA